MHVKKGLQSDAPLGRTFMIPAGQAGPLSAYFGNMNCTWKRVDQSAPSSGVTTL